MQPIPVIEKTWLSRKPSENAFSSTLTLMLFLFAVSFSFFIGVFRAEELLPATQNLVFQQHQFWRAWTTLFIHGDLNHLLSNSLLLVPLTFLLAGHFGPVLLPLMGIVVGGFINLLVLKTLPEQVSLIGISGVVYWMGATWLTLYVLIDRKVKFRKRFAYALFLSLMLFVPETYKPEISYLSHFVGFVFGIISALAIYYFGRKKFLAAETIVYLHEEDDSLGDLTLRESYGDVV